MLASRLAHQRMIERPAIPAHLAEPTPRTIARGHRQLWGDRLYTAFASYIKKIEPEARANNIWREGFNAGMVTASVLDTIDYESQVDELLSDEKKIEAVVADCLVMYA
jgi:hypothetical protein